MFTFAKDRQTARVAAEFYINAINVMPELEWASGYFFSLALMFAVDVALYMWFKKIRWL